MSFLMAGAAIVSAGIGVANAIGAGRSKREAEREEAIRRKEMDRLKAQYANLDTSNPFLNMENTMEDLTVNQQQAQFEAQQIQQQQANIMGGLRGAAGSSGIAALAQTMAQQGQLATQRASASIGQQESMNQRLSSQEAGRLQGQERRGEVMSRNWERDKVSTLLGMSQQETAAARQQGAIAQQAKWDAMGDVAGSVMQAGVAGGNYMNSQSGLPSWQAAGSGGGLSGYESQSQLNFLSSYGYNGQ